MRTTIEISAELRRKLVAEALARNMKGYSPIISEAFLLKRLYFRLKMMGC